MNLTPTSTESWNTSTEGLSCQLECCRVSFYFFPENRVWVMNSSEYTQPKRYFCASMESPLASMLSFLKPSDLILWRCLLKCKYSIENNRALMEEWDSSNFLRPQNDDRPASLPVISVYHHKQKTFPTKTKKSFKRTSSMLWDAIEGWRALEHKSHSNSIKVIFKKTKAKVSWIYKKVTLVYYLTKYDYCTVMIPLQDSLEDHISL